MSKVVSIWGNPGSGKSLFSSILANVFTKTKKKKAIIVSCDTSTPMLPVWTSEKTSSNEQSVGKILTEKEITAELVAKHVVLLKRYPNIGLLGFASGEAPLLYPQIRYGQVKQMVSIVGKLVDYVILDCSSDFANPSTPAFIEMADVGVCILTPDQRGICYFQSQIPTLSDSDKYPINEHIKLAGLARPFHPIERTTETIGEISGLLPYLSKVDRNVQQAGMFGVFEDINKNYLLSLHEVVSRLYEAAPEQ